MSTRISQENEQFIEFEIESGSYQTRAQLLNDAIGLLRRRRELQRDIQAGINSGPSVPARVVLRRLEKKAREHATRRHTSLTVVHWVGD